MEGFRVQAQDLVDAQLYASQEAVLQDALRHLLQDRPDLRIALAVHHYQTDVDVSLARAAATAGVSMERMKDILISRGLDLRLGPATLEEAQAEAATIGAWLDADPG